MDPHRTLDRRGFLRASLQLGSLALAASAGSAMLAACGPTSRATTTTSIVGPPTPVDWKKLAAALTGSLVLPDQPSYQLARLLYNSKFIDLHPQAIALCATPDDVARCIAFATSHGLDLAARSGGHSYGGYSSCSGLVIDVSAMSSVTVDLASNTARVGAGATLIDVYNAIGREGRLLPAGSCPSVGIAGLALGGGVGVFGPKYGLTSDNVRGVDLITADARRVVANDEHHSDLFWASRGGGGGNFAVATSFDFAVHPMPEVTLFTLTYPWAAGAEMLDAWQSWVARAPDELWSNCHLFSEGTVGYLAQVSGVYCGATKNLASLLASMKATIPGAPIGEFVGSSGYVKAMMIEAGCSDLSVASCHLAPRGRLSRAPYSSKSSFVDGPMTSGQVLRFVDAVVRLHEEAPTVGGGLSFDAYGGAINRVASDATAFVHRDKLAGIQATYSWSAYTPSAEIAAGERWLTRLGTDVFDTKAGAYQNYIDPTLADWKVAYYGSNLNRLVAVKKKYDGENIFRFAQSVPTAL